MDERRADDTLTGAPEGLAEVGCSAGVPEAGVPSAGVPSAGVPERDEDEEGAAERQSFVRHELRSPLAVLRPVIDMLRDGSAGDLSDQQRKYVDMLDRNASRLEAMVASFADSGWLEVAPLPRRDDLVALDEVVAEAISTLPNEPGRTPRCDVNAAPCAVRGDRECLRRALRDVLLNACAASPPNGEVKVLVQVDVDAAVVRVTVSDAGPGMPADELAHAFDFGFQGKAAQTRPDRGLGIGLYVTRALVAQHGGRVWLESVEGEGTSAFVELPLARG